MQDEQLTYTSAMKELEEIVQKLQRPDCEIDQLCQLTERSVKLLAFCKEKLTKTDEQLVKLLDSLDN
ncbi:MAG: exodeoxyribonuclease VII small subunit [Bacteroidales bacterium]|jgi:exodeoxyribonuclease VII small subunit|nr:exodeoxyribonuclease VII small subunit [Bacteroidales bacterium]